MEGAIHSPSVATVPEIIFAACIETYLSVRDSRNFTTIRLSLYFSAMLRGVRGEITRGKNYVRWVEEGSNPKLVAEATHSFDYVIAKRSHFFRRKCPGG